MGGLGLLYAQTFNTLQNRYFALLFNQTVGHVSHRALADWWQDTGDEERALAYWQRAYVDEPTTELAMRITNTLLAQGEWHAVMTLAQNRLNSDPNNAWAHAQLAFLLAPSNVQNALTHLRPILLDRIYGITASAIYSILVGDTPSSTHAFQIGAHFAESQQFPYAELAFHQAATQNYPAPEAMAYTGYMRALQGKSGETYLAEARLFAPSTPNILLVDALYHRALGNYQASLEILMNAHSLSQTDNDIITEIGVTYGLLGDPITAEGWLTEALRIQPENDIARFYLAQSLLAQGENNRAMPHLERLVHRNTRYQEEARALLDNLSP